MTQEFRSGLWIKDSNSFINVEHVLPDTSLSNIHIYEFDNNFHLRTITNAKKVAIKNLNGNLRMLIKQFLIKIKFLQIHSKVQIGNRL